MAQGAAHHLDGLHLPSDRSIDDQPRLWRASSHRLDAGKEATQRRALFGLRPPDALTKSLGRSWPPRHPGHAVTRRGQTAIFDQLTQQHIDFMLSKIPKNRFVLVDGARGDGRLARVEDCSSSDRRGVRHFGGRATY